MKKINFGIFLIALVTLMVELLMTRVFDVILIRNLAYIVITFAVFAFGLSGIYGALRPMPVGKNVRGVISVLAVLVALFLLLILPAMNILPFDYEEIPEQPLMQLLFFAGMYLTLVIPFFISGLILAFLYTAYAETIQSLYFWDLLGAAIGCIIIIPFIPIIGPGGLLFVASALALLASAMFSEKKGWSIAAIVAAVIIVSVPFFHLPEYFTFKEHTDKRGLKSARESGKIEYSRWDPISKIDVFDEKRRVSQTDSIMVKHVVYDGGSQSTNIFPFDGDFKTLRDNIETLHKHHFWQLGVLASHYHKRDTNHRALVIGSAGGQETKAALMYGARHVDAVELVGTVVNIGKIRYAQYNGNLFNNPRVNAVRGEGRSFVRAGKEPWDVIQIFSNHTSSSIAQGTGAMDPTYLQTADAYMEYFRHLTKDGILHINHQIYPKMVATAALAWKNLERTDFQKHVVVFQKVGRKDKLPTLLIKMTPWTQNEVDDLKTLFAIREDQYEPHLVEDPIHPENSFLSPAFYAADMHELKSLAKQVKFRTMPPTDNKPYFNFLRKTLGKVKEDPQNFMNLSTADYLNSQIKRYIPMDVIHLFVTGAVAILFVGVFIFLPLYFSGVGRTKWPQKGNSIIYFSSLGAGFIIIELVLIQIFMHFIGFPLYTYATVIFTILLGAGIGSVGSRKIGISLEEKWSVPFWGVLTIGLILLLVHQYAFGLFIGLPMPARVLISSILIIPLGFFMGMPFPLGILSIKEQPAGAIAWAWGVNGLFTVIGGLMSIVLSIFMGFRLTLLIALMFYVLAFWIFSKLRLLGGSPVSPTRTF